MDFLGLDVGWGEILLIMVVLLIFVGPARLPEVLREIRKAYQKLKDATNELSREIEEMADEVKSEVTQVKTEAKNATGTSTSLSKDLKGIINDLNEISKEPPSKAQPAGVLPEDKSA